MKANVEWILRQRRLCRGVVPGGDRLWCKGLQPAHQVTPDSGGQLMQFYESEAYYWLAVQRFAGIWRRSILPKAHALAVEAETYRKDLKAAVERSIACSPVVLVRDGTYRSFLPFACYVRGLRVRGTWSWRRPGSGAHVGGLYWDTIQGAEPLVSPAALLPLRRPARARHARRPGRPVAPGEPEACQRTPGYDPEKDGLPTPPGNISPAWSGTPTSTWRPTTCPNFLRSWLNQYAVQILPNDGYTFPRAHDRRPARQDLRGSRVSRAVPQHARHGGRRLVVAGSGDSAGMAGRGQEDQGRTPRRTSARWPTRLSRPRDGGKIKATVTMPSRGGQKGVLLRFRHPKAAPIKRVTVNGRPWQQFDKDREVIRLEGLTGTVAVEAAY